MLSTIETLITNVANWLVSLAFFALYIVVLDGPMLLALAAIVAVGVAILAIPIGCGWRLLRCLERRSVL